MNCGILATGSEGRNDLILRRDYDIPKQGLSRSSPQRRNDLILRRDYD